MKNKLGGSWRIWTARMLIAGVLGVNLQCAMLFMLWPGDFVIGFELSGVAGRAMVQSLGILFLMWNVPYAAACWRPQRLWSLIEASVMQALGLGGETALLLTLPPGHFQLSATAVRFIWFDAGGFILLCTALILVLNARKLQVSSGLKI